MVQTRSATKRIEPGQAHAHDGVFTKDTIVEPASGDGVPSPAKKSRRGDATAPKKRRRGKPGELCRLNLDVLFLIAAYIHPIDLLSLARTCKSLRELLMDKSSVFVWRTARQQAKDLPDCPVDLTEPEYANLMFYARCHSCGKYATTTFWNIRRRYCPDCRRRRLRRFATSPEVIRTNAVLPAEYITVKREYTQWFDKDQVTSFMHEYRQSPDKTQFLSDKQKQYSAICQHAKKCEAWQKQKESEHKADQTKRREERKGRIFERLEQLGYRREIAYYGYYEIQRSRSSDLRTSKPLTDKEWDLMSPEWIKIMNHFRSQRMETKFYEPRRRSLVSEYWRYVTRPKPDAPTFDLLPHVADLARFPPFRDIIKAPEESRMDDNPFASAFAQLPVLVAEWKKKLDAELAELVKIPLHLSSENASSCRVLRPGSTTRAESLETDLDKLQLACAVFQTDNGTGVFAHPDVFSTPMVDNSLTHSEDNSESPESLSNRFGIRFLGEASYIVQACGLDPHVAKVDDMNRRNARLRCLCCADSANLVMDWRNAMWHARAHHHSCEIAPLAESPRWRLFGDEYVDAAQAVVQSFETKSLPSSLRCLLCRSHVGDIIRTTHSNVADHLYSCHNLFMKIKDIKQGVHYMPIGICNSQVVAEMVEEGERVTFRVSLNM